MRFGPPAGCDSFSNRLFIASGASFTQFCCVKPTDRLILLRDSRRTDRAISPKPVPNGRVFAFARAISQRNIAASVHIAVQYSVLLNFHPFCNIAVRVQFRVCECNFVAPQYSSAVQYCTLAASSEAPFHTV